MAVSAKEKRRAKTVRAKLRKGKATETEVEWLRGYKGKTKHQPRRLANELVGAAAEAPAGPEPAPAAPSANTGKTGASTPARASSPMVRFSWPEAPAEPAQPPPPGAEAPKGHNVQSCPHKNCPHCKNVRAAQTCGTTGKKFWPPMAKFVARMFAKGILKGLSWIFRLLRKDKYLVAPGKAEVDMLAEGIREVQIRRMSFLGAIDDLVMVGGTLFEYSIRAVMTPPPKEAPASGPDSKSSPAGSGESSPPASSPTPAPAAVGG